MARSKFISLDSLSFQEFDENSELIPLMTTEDEKEINNIVIFRSILLSITNINSWHTIVGSLHNTCT